MGQRANATALRLFNKKIVKTGNLWFTNNKNVYSQYIHDDMMLSDYIKNVFKHKNFEVLDINIKRSAKNLFINVCLFTPNHRLKNSVSELKTSLYYSDIINLKSYDYDNQFYPIKTYNSYKNYNYSLIGNYNKFNTNSIKSNNHFNLKHNFSSKFNKGFNVNNLFFNKNKGFVKFNSDYSNIFSNWMMQLFSFNSNNLPFEKSKVKLNNNIIKSPYLLKLSKMNEKINIPFILKQLNNLLIDNSLNINLNINTISNLNIDLKKNNSNNKTQMINKKAIIAYDTSQISNYLSYILTQTDINLKLDNSSNKNFFKYNNKKSTNYYITNNSIVSKSSHLHYYNVNKLDLIKFDNFLNKNNQNYVNINLFNKLNQFNLYGFSSSFDNFFDYYNLFKNNITDIKNSNIILKNKNKITNNPYLFSLYQKHFVLNPSSIDLIESKINLLKKDQVFKYMFFAILFKNPDFLANYIADSIKYKKFGVLQQFLNSLVSNMNIIVLLFNENGIKLQGIRIDCSGRFNGIDRTRTINLNYGSLSFNKLDSNIVYGNDTSFTKYGSFGIKVWFSYK